MTIKSTAIFMAAVLAAPAVTLASSIEIKPIIRIGDTDGFGFGTAAGLVNSSGTSANADQLNPLAVGDRLPDLNKNGLLAALHGDDFDNRLNEGSSCLFASCTVNSGTQGQLFTDIALSMTYDYYNGEHPKSIPGAAPSIYNANTGTWGKGGEFPGSKPSSSGFNQPGFIFDFTIGKTALEQTSEIFFNLVFADYDVMPAFVQIDNGRGNPNHPVRKLDVSTHTPDADGEIQSAYVALAFDEVFSENAAGTDWVGYLEVDFFAGIEPYTAFDYVELSTEIATEDPEDPDDPTPTAIPLPPTLFLVLMGLVGMGYRQARIG